jgi:septal ring factor EnvC (AmiA/AmiB activator)
MADRRRAVRRLCRLAQVLLLPTAALACAAVILLVNTTRDSVRNGVTTLVSAEQLSADMATLAQRLTGVTRTLGGGLTDSAATVDNLARLTGTVRSVVDVVGPLSPKIRETAAELEKSQANFEALKTRTLTTQAELSAAQPDLDRAAASISRLPDTLRATRASLEAQDHRLGLLIWLGCGAVILFAVVLFVLLQALVKMAFAVSPGVG